MAYKQAFKIVNNSVTKAVGSSEANGLSVVKEKDYLTEIEGLKER